MCSRDEGGEGERDEALVKTGEKIAVGHYPQLMEELRLDDQKSFYNFLRITPLMFDELLERIIPFIGKRNTRFRQA